MCADKRDTTAKGTSCIQYSEKMKDFCFFLSISDDEQHGLAAAPYDGILTPDKEHKKDGLVCV